MNRVGFGGATFRKYLLLFSGMVYEEQGEADHIILQEFQDYIIYLTRLSIRVIPGAIAANVEITAISRFKIINNVRSISHFERKDNFPFGGVVL